MDSCREMLSTTSISIRRRRFLVAQQWILSSTVGFLCLGKRIQSYRLTSEIGIEVMIRREME